MNACELLVFEGVGSRIFPDVPDDPASLYPDDFVAQAAAEGLINGYRDGLFRPYADVTRAQVLTIVVRAAKEFKPRALQTPPADWKGALPATDATHGKNIRLAEYNGLLAGIDLSVFAVGATATRGEIAQIVRNYRLK
ncbi:MAG: S-layer homology domain-containing protein [Thermoleophilia bacterium]